MSYLLLVSMTAAAVLVGLRWIRVAQREHYIPGAATRFAFRWWNCRWENRLLFLVAVGGGAVSFRWPPAALAAYAVLAVAPLGLPIRGRSAPLRWTPRARRLGVVSVLLWAATVGAAQVVGLSPLSTGSLAAVAIPSLVDLAALMSRPVEHLLSRSYVERAAAKLAQIRPIVVAITGSYGKTSTKEYTRHFLGARYNVLASPGSFNNRLGLARTVNELLTPETEVFVAEMGTYGKGEIAELCDWLHPSMSVITAVGPVHLERFGSLAAIATAKAEILSDARVGVINADEPLIVAAATGREPGMRVIRCSAHDPTADVHIAAGPEETALVVQGERLGPLGSSVFPMNAACAVGVALALDVPMDLVAKLLPTIPTAAHRREVVEAGEGITIIDDTYNSNPAGAASAADFLAAVGSQGRRVVVTPGMVELGSVQHQENVAFAERISKVASDLLIVGRTNRAALREGAKGGGATVTLLNDRGEAVRWVRSNLRAGDAVLYENDLPDHYP
jgi:UDP-N-acetylmuramoyl-tripeptide--D-alanyl-D-alanine ligase